MPDEKDTSAPDDAGMDTQALKRMLKRAQREPVSCALAQGDAQSGGIGLILMDRVKPPKALLTELRKQFPTARTPCFGTVSVGTEQDPKSVTFKLNKNIPVLRRKMIKALKGTGYKKVAMEGSGGET